MYYTFMLKKYIFSLYIPQYWSYHATCKIFARKDNNESQQMQLI